MNNADIVVQKLRDLQEYVFDKNASPNSIFEKISVIINQANNASKQTNTYEQQLNRVINVLHERGQFNSDVIAAFTGMPIEKAEELENDIEKAKEEILNA